jgi:hypothetical protein
MIRYNKGHRHSRGSAFLPVSGWSQFPDPVTTPEQVRNAICHLKRAIMEV